MSRKTLQELTMKDNFMFAAVMLDSEICKLVLECGLGIEIDQIDVCYEKSIVYNQKYHGVRLDVYAKDSQGTHYNVEMQVIKRRLLKRARYYHSQMDMELLESGADYETLPDSYVIFICDFDPVGLEKYRYTKKEVFGEDASYDYDDGSHTIFLSTKGKNEDEVPKRLVKFLKFIGAESEESHKDYNDELIERLQTSIEKIKQDREMGARYMVLEEMMKREHDEGRLEGRLEGMLNSIHSLISEYGVLPEVLQERLAEVTDLELLDILLKKSARVNSMEEFEAEARRLLF